VPEPRPEPVRAAGITVASVSALLTAVATIAVTLGLVSQTDADTLVTALVAVVGAVLALVHAVLPILEARKTRELVTPLASPVDSLGRRLLPEPLPPFGDGTGHPVMSKPPVPPVEP
jgi:hypothetical protein